MMKAEMFIVFSLFFTAFAVVDSNHTQKVTVSIDRLSFHYSNAIEKFMIPRDGESRPRPPNPIRL